MLKETTKNYTHVYMDLTDEIIYFHTTSAPCRLGKSLLDFIYMDLKEAFLHTDPLHCLPAADLTETSPNPLGACRGPGPFHQPLPPAHPDSHRKKSKGR